MRDKTVTAFKALGDPVRLRLFYLLSQREELCVCHLTDTLQLPQSTISRQLGVLRHAGLVATRRDGKWMYYRLNGQLAAAFAGVVEAMNSTALQADAAQMADILPC